MTDYFTATETGLMLASSVEQALARTGYQPGGDGSTLWPVLSEIGLAGVEITPDHGGSGGTLSDLAPSLTALGKRACVTPILSSVVAASWLIEAAGSADQKARWLPALASGEAAATLAHGEHAARGHLYFVETQATRTASGWELNGAKEVVADGGEADLFIVSARLSGGSAEADGLALFLVPADTPELKRRKFALYDGSLAAGLSFDALTLPEDALLGVAGEASPLIAQTHDRAIAALCAEAVGVMEGLFDLTLDYVRTREQFGQPIGRFQAIQHRMADMFTELELAKSMASYAVLAAGLEDGPARARAMSAAKFTIANAARMIGQSSLQLHGAIALTQEYAAGHYFKRLTRIERQFGDACYHLDRFAGLAA